MKTWNLYIFVNIEFYYYYYSVQQGMVIFILQFQWKPSQLIANACMKIQTVLFQKNSRYESNNGWPCAHVYWVLLPLFFRYYLSNLQFFPTLRGLDLAIYQRTDMPTFIVVSWYHYSMLAVIIVFSSYMRWMIIGVP